jgi:hypothetical protein
VTIEKYGAMGLLAILIWWITQSLSKRMEGLEGAVKGLADVVQHMPCDRVRELEDVIKQGMAAQVLSVVPRGEESKDGCGQS